MKKINLFVKKMKYLKLIESTQGPQLEVLLLNNFQIHNIFSKEQVEAKVKLFLTQDIEIGCSFFKNQINYVSVEELFFYW